MKKLLLLSVTGMFLISCGGGWSDEDVSMAMAECMGDMSKDDCECLINKCESKFDSYQVMEDTFDGKIEMSEEEGNELMLWFEEAAEDCDIEMDF